MPAGELHLVTRPRTVELLEHIPKASLRRRCRRVCAQRPLKPLGGGWEPASCVAVGCLRCNYPIGAGCRIVSRLARKAVAPHHIRGPRTRCLDGNGCSRDPDSLLLLTAQSPVWRAIEVGSGACDGLAVSFIL